MSPAWRPAKKKPTDLKPPRNGLADLRPNATIKCFWCGEEKPAAGAVKFYAYQVCAPCAAEVQAKSAKKKVTT